MRNEAIVAIATVEQVAHHLERHLGVTVRQVTRQTRWRPTWFVDAERDGASLPLVVRADRVDTEVFPLQHEVAFHRILQEHGIPVPRIHAWIDELGAVVLDLVPGKPDFDGVPEAERDVVVDEYLQVLARIHQLPIEPFVAAGVLRAKTPAESSVVAHWHLERLWRAKKQHPNPLLEFCLGWLHRNPPRSHGRETPILLDTGQFHHQGGHLVTILDLEFGHVGDPMLDLALWRMRDTVIPFGDFPRLYARYEDLSGTPVDMEAIRRHHFAGTLENELIFGPAVQDPVPETDLMNNMQWNSETNLHAVETLAEFLGVDLPAVELPEPRRTRQANTHGHLVGTLRRLSLSTDDYLLQHDLRLAFRMARHLQRVDEIGAATVEADLDDLHRLLGHRPATWWDGDEELERFVLADATTGRYDAELVRLFYRRNMRVHQQLGPPGSKMVAHYPTQRFDNVPAG
jgi:aminoglycoside phosphotransferase (APT) family kinase protein